MSDEGSGRGLPTGTVTFLRTDVEGSMGLARSLGRAWDSVNSAHLATIASAVERHGGVVVRTEGDALFGAFGEAGAGASAASDAQRALHDGDWGVPGGLRVRMGLHSGEAHRAGDDYGGFDVSRAARIAAAGHGGQIVVSGATAALIADQLPPGTRLDDLGTHHLRDVPRPERLYQLSIEGLPSEFAPPRTAGAVVGNLPDRLTSFLGRDAELAAVAELARSARLITLTGTGGIGKTSLAIEVARQLAPEHPDGAWFVALADVTDPAEVPAAIAHGIGLFDGPERSAADALLPYVTTRSMVIVLDNVEQVLEAAEHVTAIVRASPATRVIVTSRAPLHVAGEHEVAVRPLAARRRPAVHRAGPGGPGGLAAQRRRSRSSRRSARCWTTCLSASSSLPRAPRCCRRASSAIASPAACPCPDQASGMPRAANARSTRRSPGATTSWTRRASACSTSSPSSRAASTWSRSMRSAWLPEASPTGSTTCSSSPTAA